MLNVLLPLDLYRDSPHALQALLSFLQGLEGPFKVFLLRTYTVPVSGAEEVIGVHDELQARTGKQLQRECEAAKDWIYAQRKSEGGDNPSLGQAEKLSLEPLLQMGNLSNVIKRIVREKRIDYLVVGSSQDASKQGDIISLATRLRCPTLFLPSQPEI